MTLPQWMIHSRIGKAFRRWHRATEIIRERMDQERRGKRAAREKHLLEE